MMKRLAKILAVVAAVLVMLFVVFRVPDTDRAEMVAKYGSAPSEFVSLPTGVTMHVRDEGPRDAPVIVLLHGSNDDLHTWQGWVDALKSKFRVIRVDQRGHGLTGAAADGRYRTEAFAADVEALAQERGIERFVLAGNSMGGGIALQYALSHPDRLDGLVLVDAAGAPVKREGGGNLAFAILRLPGINRIGMELMPRSVVEKSMKQSVADPDGVKPDTVDRIWEMARYPGNREATLTRFSQSYNTYTAEQVGGITVPTLVMWGDKDALIPLAAGEWLAKTLPEAVLVHYGDLGHLPMQEAPERTASDLIDWLTTLPLNTQIP